ERYRLDAELGRGGYAVVYRGTQLSTGQPVAIKVLLSHRVISDKADVERDRFVREAKLMARLKHPNIVRLIDTGEAESGERFIVLELVEGHDLSDHLCTHGPLPVDDAVDLMRQVLDGLSAAHDAGV